MNAKRTYSVRAWTAAELVGAATVEAASLTEAMEKAEAVHWSNVAFEDPGDNQPDPHYLLVFNDEGEEPEELSKNLSCEANLKAECDKLCAINRELVAALQACRPFVAFTQAYDQRRMTASEAKACDEAIRLTNAVLRKTGGIYG